MKHETRIVQEHITTTDHERLPVFRVHCSCGFLGSPYVREHVAAHEAKKHELEGVDE
jgi:hypothetical protein